jgi:hypothetical protein
LAYCWPSEPLNASRGRMTPKHAAFGGARRGGVARLVAGIDSMRVRRKRTSARQSSLTLQRHRWTRAAPSRSLPALHGSRCLLWHTFGRCRSPTVPAEWRTD